MGSGVILQTLSSMTMTALLKQFFASRRQRAGNTHHSVLQHHIVRPEDREKMYTLINVSPTNNKQEQETDAWKSSIPCSFFQRLHWKYVFRSFVRLCVGSRAMRYSRAIRFSHCARDVWLAALTDFLSLCDVLTLRWVLMNVWSLAFYWNMETTQSGYLSHSLASFTGRPMGYKLEVFVRWCVYAHAPCVCESVRYG